MLRRRIILQALVVLFAIMLTAALPVYAADELWYQEYGGNGYDEFYDLVQLSDGGFALVGNLQMPDSDYTDIWLTRTDSDGDIIWNRTYAGSSWVSDLGHSLIEVSTGGYLIVGRDTGNGAWMIRTDTSGVVVWNSSFELMGTSIEAYCVTECNDGGFAVTGDYGFLLRLDANGNHLWNKTFITESTDEYDWRVLRSVIEVSGGHFVLVGETDSLGAGDRDVWLIRADADGNELWNRTYGGTEFDVGYSVIEVGTGGFAIAAATFSSEEEGISAWLIRVDGDGNELWNQLYNPTTGTSGGTTEGRDVVECSDGGFALTGFANNIDTGDNDVWLGRTDSDGVLQWHKTFGGEYMDEGRALVELTAGGFAVAGYMRSADMGPANGILVTFEDLAPPESPDYTLLIAIGIGGAVILIVIVVYMRKKRS
jgi:predicted secreted protein